MNRANINQERVSELLCVINEGPELKIEKALIELPDISEKQYVDLYRKFLTNKNWHLRLAAAWALGKTLGKDALDELTPMLEDRAFGVREDVQKIISIFCK